MEKSKKTKKYSKRTRFTYIGGQAVMEGVMMRGKKSMATAVRDPEGKIQIESIRLTPPEKKSKFSRLPFIRGIFNFVNSIITGNKVLMRSVEVAEGDDDQPSKAEKWLAEKHKININAILNTIASIIGIILAMGIFVMLPQFLTGLTKLDTTGWEGVGFNLIEGAIRITIFILYILSMSLSKTLKRVFMCHGAEHKTITCYECELPLTVDNVRKCSRVHDRCGTTFLFLVMVVSIFIFSIVNAIVGPIIYTGNDVLNFFIRFIFKIAMLPLVAGVSYEILKALAKTRNKFFMIFKAPGLLLQRITTSEPEDGMIECAIAAFEKVLEMDENDNIPETLFATPSKLTELLANTKKRFKDNGIDEEEAEWIFSLKLDIPKSAINNTERILKVAQVKEILKIADERLTGRPLWYVIGDTDFYGYKINVDERVLIPRRETEELAQMAISAAETGYKILDLCTGSGAMAIAISKELEKNKRDVKVTATDISEDALNVAKKNAEENEANVTFIKSNLLEQVRDRFDIIVSNPPYIPTKDIDGLQREVKDFEPHLALDGGEDGLDFYRKIAQNVSKNINRGGILMMEVGMGQAQKVAALFKYCDYTMVIKDMQGVDRFVKIVF